MPTVDSIENACTAYNVYHGVTGLNTITTAMRVRPTARSSSATTTSTTSCLTPKTGPSICSGSPTNDMSIDVGYVGNRGKHQVLPLPFNEPVLCTPGNYQSIAACNGQQYSYGLQVLSNVNAPSGYYGTGDTKSTPYAMANEPYDTI